MHLVVFHAHGNHWADKWLHPDFQHVFCCVDDGTYWIRIDSQAGRPVVEVVASSDFDISEFYVNEGYTVVEVDRATPPIFPLTTSNCVGMVKAILGINAPLAFTPHRLFRRLQCATSHPSSD